MTSYRPTVSVVVLNWQRPGALRQIISGLTGLRYPNFEVIVVGDRPVCSDLGLTHQERNSIRYYHSAVANISRSRNIAIAAACGEIVAFCDDDAVPEPDWLCELVKPFEDPAVGASGGTVRAADGISFQWRGARIDQTGRVQPMELDPGRSAELYAPDAVLQASFMGVNGAYRRSSLLEIGGFDEAYRYYLDESDAIRRLGRAGWLVALVPNAEVVHYQERNDTRGRLAKPLNLREIGASKAHFIRVHAPHCDVDAELSRFHANRRRRLDRYIRIGVMDRHDRDRVMQSLESGLKDGVARLPLLPLLRQRHEPMRREKVFRPFALRFGNEAKGCAVIAPFYRRSQASALASALIAQGRPVSVFETDISCSSPSMTFRNGVWHHRLPAWSARSLSQKETIWAEVMRAQDRRGFEQIIDVGSDVGRGSVPPIFGGLAHWMEQRLRPTGGVSAHDVIGAVKRSFSSCTLFPVSNFATVAAGNASRFASSGDDGAMHLMKSGD